MSLASAAASQTQHALSTQQEVCEAPLLVPQVLTMPQKRLTRGPLWARLPPLRTFAPSSSQSQPQSQLPPCSSAAAKESLFPQQLSLPDRVSTTRVLLQDTQACIQKLSARMDAIASRNEHAVKEVELARTALETSGERCVAQISEAVRDSRTSIMERIETQSSALDKMQETLNNNSTRLEAVYRLYDVQSSILSSLLQSSHSQSTQLNSLQQQSTNITQSTLPLEPLLQAIPLRIDNMTHAVRTAVEDVFSHAIPALLERTLARIQAQPTTPLIPEALSSRTNRQQQNFSAHIASDPSPAVLTASSPTVVGTNGPPSTPLIDKISSAADFATIISVDTAYAVPPASMTNRLNTSQKRKARTQSFRTSAAPPQNTRNPSAEMIDSIEASVDRPLKRTRTEEHTTTSSEAAQQATAYVNSSETGQPAPKASKRPALSRAKTTSRVRQPTSSNNKTPRARRPGASPPDPIAGPATRTRSVYNFAVEAGVSIDSNDSDSDSPAQATSSLSFGPDLMRHAQAPSLPPRRSNSNFCEDRANADGDEGSISSEALLHYKAASVSNLCNHPDVTSPSEAAEAEAAVVVPIDGRLSEVPASSHAALKPPQPSSKRSHKAKSKTKSTPTHKAQQSKAKSSKKSKTKAKAKATAEATATAAARSLIRIMDSSSQSQDRSAPGSSGDAVSDENAAAFDAALAHIAKDVNYMQDPDLVGHTQHQSRTASVRKHDLGVDSPVRPGSERRFGSVAQTNILPLPPSQSQIDISDSEFDHFFPELADF